ncbi:hypothetical protein V3481_017178 [Fusarium oxysporum f. sp. vasinfectum]
MGSSSEQFEARRGALKSVLRKYLSEAHRRACARLWGTDWSTRGQSGLKHEHGNVDTDDPENSVLSQPKINAPLPKPHIGSIIAQSLNSLRILLLRRPLPFLSDRTTLDSVPAAQFLPSTASKASAERLQLNLFDWQRVGSALEESDGPAASPICPFTYISDMLAKSCSGGLIEETQIEERAELGLGVFENNQEELVLRRDDLEDRLLLRVEDLLIDRAGGLLVVRAVSRADDP